MLIGLRDLNVELIDGRADRLISCLIPVSILGYLVVAPYTKVEESFSVQATHDILTYGVSWEKGALRVPNQYDHLTFTGPVPRTFVGPVVLAGVSWPFVWLAGNSGGEIGRQMIVRAVLGLFNSLCLLSFRNGVAKSFGRNAANWFTLFQVSQFHIIFYASRTLPNFFAFGLTTIAMRNLLPLAGRSPTSRSSKARFSTALTLLTISGIVFRSEIALLLVCHTLYLFLAPHIRLSVLTITSAGLFAMSIGLILTVPIDTFFWRTYPPTFLWPELVGFLYNIVHGNASNWGKMSWHFYFTSALPRLLSNPLTWQVCIPFALLTPIIRRPSLDILVPNVLFVSIYSFQPHKEWRFIIYVIPSLLAVASAGASWIWTRRARNFTYRVLSLALIASTLATFAASAGMVLISRLNYPGGEALTRLHTMVESEGREHGVKRLHMGNLACMTGITRFLERQPPPLAERTEDGSVFWVYDKTENATMLLDPFFWEGIDYAIAEDPKRVPGRWEVIDVVEGFAGVALMRPGEGEPVRDMSFGDFKAFAVDEGRRWAAEAKGLWRQRSWTGENTRWLIQSLSRIWDVVQATIRQHVTRGWWLRVKMEPRLKSLKKERGSMMEAVVQHLIKDEFGERPQSLEDEPAEPRDSSDGRDEL